MTYEVICLHVNGLMSFIETRFGFSYGTQLDKRGFAASSHHTFETLRLQLLSMTLPVC